MQRVNTKSVLAVLASAGFATSSALAGGGPLVTLFTEDFNGFTLFPNIEEGVLTGPLRTVNEAFFGDAVDATPFNGAWSANGWSQTFSPAGVGTAEWQGWSIADHTFWFESDFQLREEFTRGSGGIAVCDPDEWDDFDPVLPDPEAAGLYVTDLDSPVISLGGSDANSMVVTFDSSWRPEDNQKVAFSVRFDGGTWQEVFRWTSDPIDPDFKPDATNEAVSVNINNPANASTVQVRFSMFDAGNDWWWAIDNLIVAATGGEPVSPPTAFSLSAQTFNETLTPAISWTQSINATQYEITFANDAGFTSADYEVTLPASELSLVVPGGQLSAGVYFVRVTARNTIGTASASATIGLDNPCPGDVNGDGSQDFFDVITFLGSFSAGCGG